MAVWFALIIRIGGNLIPGLRMFVAQSADSDSNSKVVYSRRAEGPYYKWRITAPDTWEVTRVHGGLLAADLCRLSWKNLPQALQRRVVNHYEE